MNVKASQKIISKLINALNLLKKEKNKLTSKRAFHGDSKIFCIGRNKTGTTSLKQALSDWGYTFGNQEEAELYIDCYRNRNFLPIARYCEPFDAVQDVPFSWPFTFIAMDRFYPGSKFILTVRDTPEQWYNSIVKFHSKLFGNGKVPRANNLKNADYRYKGWIWEVNRAVYNTPEDDPYNKNIMIKNYVFHNRMVKEYFRTKTDKLLVLNPGEENAYQQLAKFLDEKPLYQNMPWENRTETINTQ